MAKTQKCSFCQKEFTIFKKDSSFYSRFDLPEPEKCPDCRERQRLSFRNEKTLYKRKCDAGGEPIIAAYPSDSPYTVYCPKHYHADSWDAQAFGRDFDFQKPFFEQWYKLSLKVPRLALISANNENCDYVNDVLNSKDCYLIFAGDDNEKCLYANTVCGFEVVDSLRTTYCSQSYALIECHKCSRSKYLLDCKHCIDCYFCFDCRNCTDCFLSTNLRHKKYYIENKPYSKEEYHKILSSFDFGSSMQIEMLQARFAKIFKKAPKRHLQILKSEDCLGNYITNSKNCFHCFELHTGQDSRYIYYGSRTVKDSMDCSMLINGELCYFCQTCLYKNYLNFFCNSCITSQNLTYCDSCQSCVDCFGCIGLRNKKYTILNKQYSKGDYQKLVKKIVAHMKSTGEWGRFFPVKCSYFAYNETQAHEYFPMEKKDVLARGWRWQELENQSPGTTKPGLKEIPQAGLERNFVPGTGKSGIGLPDNIKGVTSDILKQTLICQSSGKPYKIIAQELDFYRRFKIPIPRKAFLARFQDRMKRRNPRVLRKTACAQCQAEIHTTYPKDENILCAQCYRKVIS